MPVYHAGVGGKVTFDWFSFSCVRVCMYMKKRTCGRAYISLLLFSGFIGVFAGGNRDRTMGNFWGIKMLSGEIFLP